MVFLRSLRFYKSRWMLAATTFASTNIKATNSFSTRTISSINLPSLLRCKSSITVIQQRNLNQVFRPLAFQYYTTRSQLSKKHGTDSIDIRSLMMSNAGEDSNNSNKNNKTKRPRKYKTISQEGSKSTLAAAAGDTDANAADAAAADKPKKEKNYKPKHKIKEKKILRIDRILSNRGVGSRSEMHDLVKKRRVAVQDETTGELTRIKGPSVRVPKDAVIFIDGEQIKPLPIMIAYHKPKGILSAMKDDAMGRKHLGEVLDPRYVKAGLHPVGRLDYDTSGLILFSSSGDLTQRLLHPRHNVEKEYVATVIHTVDETVLRQKLEKEGVETTEGIHKAKLLHVSEPFEIQYEDKKIKISDGDDDDDDNENNNDDDDSVIVDDEIKYATNVRLIVSEGKHRMVRRMLANAGHPVIELKRERHGMILLGDLSLGEFRELSDEEVIWAEGLLSKKK